MAADKPGWAEIIADLESKRAALDSLIGSFRAAYALGALGQLGDVDVSGMVGAQGGLGAVNGGASVELPRGAFLGKSLPAAIKLYLSAVKRKQTTREIAAALKEGGVETTSENFENIVLSALNRLKAAGDALRFKDGWALAEFYPENLRARLSQEAKPRIKKPKPGKAKKAAKARKAEPSAKREGDPTTDQRIISALTETPMTPQSLAARLGAPSNIVGLALGRLAFKQKVEKRTDGTYAVKGDSTAVLRAV